MRFAWFRAGSVALGLLALVVAALPSTAAFGPCSGVADLTGTNGPDHLRGTGGSDIINGLGGNDVIRGLGGRDSICGGRGNDRLHGGSGGDVIAGGPGNDLERGGPGRDALGVGLRDGGSDSFDGGGGYDQCFLSREDRSPVNCEFFGD
jgi:Ca2+-binding RTX toxin-like protein